MLICFDNCFTHVARRLVKEGAQIIALPTFDPPTPRGVLHHLHAAMTPFRAVENRVPIVRCESNGLSQIVNARGRIVKEGPLYAPATLIADVALGSAPPTLFTRWGDWFAYLCLFLSAVVGARQLLFSPPRAILTR
jgi:apolipoprotein N-acyltransferase